MSGRQRRRVALSPQLAARVDKLWMAAVACGLVVIALGLAFDASPYLGGVLLAQTALFGWANERLSRAQLVGQNDGE